MALKGVTTREQGLLEAVGLWGIFVEHRASLIGVGFTPSGASERALRVFMPDGQPVAPDALDLENSLAEAAKGNGTPVAADTVAKEAPYGTLKVAPTALAGKTATETEVARWVARNIDNPAADPQECPDPFAWTLLRMCRENPEFALMFVKDIWTKLLVSQARNGEEDTGGKMDGTPTVELIQRIRMVRDKSNSGVVQLEARRVHSPEIAGSSPAPASFQEGE